MRDRNIKGIKAIVLAAGKGVRMNSELPKVLHPLMGRPLIVHVIQSLWDAGIGDIIVVVGYRGEEVLQTLGNSVRYVWQREQMGTGHAVMQAETELKDYTGWLLVACGDVPLIRPATFRRLMDEAGKPGIKASVLTMVLEEPFGYGRIIKDARGHLVRIIEEKDAAPDEKKIREVNTGTYGFDGRYLFEGLKTIGTNNAQREYYLPDVFQYINSAGYSAGTLVLEDAAEGSGINSREELLRLEEYLAKRR